MDRLKNSLSQKHLRSLAIKHGMHNANPVEKIDSPLIKVNPNGSVTCVICRSNLKSVNLWKVHINSKAHKSNVKEAKEMKDMILNSKPPTATRSISAQQKQLSTRKMGGTNLTANQVEAKTVVQKKTNTVAKDLDGGNPTSDPLPEEFFDVSAPDAKVRNADVNAAEWELFQREIQEVSRVSHEIFVNDQKNLAVEKEIVEINEQIQHWSKVLDLEDKRKRLHHIVESNKDQRIESREDEESSEGETFEEYPDWRSKGFK